MLTTESSRSISSFALLNAVKRSFLVSPAMALSISAADMLSSTPTASLIDTDPTGIAAAAAAEDVPTRVSVVSVSISTSS